MTRVTRSSDALNVLVADDQPDVLHAIRLLLKANGHHADTVETPHELLSAAEKTAFDVIVMDMNYARDTTSGQEGLDVIRKLRTRNDDTPIIVMTAWGTVDLAVEAMRRGASDFVQKPWDNQRLLESIIEQAGRGRRAMRAREEVEIARNVQRKLLPQVTKPLSTLDYAGICIPAREVGGDYYDFLDLGPAQLGIVLADVSGKGVAAALLMANLQALFRTHTDLETINRLFLESTPPEHYATVFFAIYDEVHRALRYVNCGHPAALVLRAGGGVERLEATATVLGMFDWWSYEQQRIQLAPGDRVMICSDGILESDGVTDESLCRFLRCGDAADCVKAAASVAAGADSDDATAVVLRAL